MRGPATEPVLARDESLIRRRKDPARPTSKPATTMRTAVQSDQRLLALARDGDERAFEAFVRRHRRSLLRYCRRMGLSDSRAEDVVQQSLLRAWLALERGGEVHAPKAWLYRTVHNTAVNALRATRDHAPLEDGVRHETAVSAEGDFERRVAVRQTLRGVAGLPRMQREAIMLTAFDGRSHEEIALALGVTHGAVRGLLYRARATLRDAAAAVVPQPALIWASGLLGRMTPTAGRLAEISAPAGGADVGGALAKGAALAATAAVLAVGTGVVALPSHLAHRSKAAAVALGMLPATAEAEGRDFSASPGRVGSPQQRTSQTRSAASTERPAGRRTTATGRRQAERRADRLGRRELRGGQIPDGTAERGPSDARVEDGPSAAEGSSRSGSQFEGSSAAGSETTDHAQGGQVSSGCDRCSEDVRGSTTEEVASQPPDAEPSRALPTGLPAGASGESSAVPNTRE